MIDFVVVSLDPQPYVLDSQVKGGVEPSTGVELDQLAQEDSRTDLVNPN